MLAKFITINIYFIYIYYYKIKKPANWNGINSN